MPAQTPLKLVALIIFTAFMAACSSSGTMTIKQPLSQPITPGKTVALSVVIDDPGHETDEEYTEVATRLRERLFGRLVSEGIFKAVVHPPEPADYSMEVKLRGARQVGQVSRVLFGIMTGPNVAQCAVQVKSREPDRLVASYEVEGASAVHPFSTEGSLDDAVREAVNNIIKGLRQ